MFLPFCVSLISKKEQKMMKMKRFLAAFLTGVLVLTQAAPALAADGFDAASSDAYFAENEDAYEDELESPDEDQEDLDAVNEDPAGTAMSEGAEAVFDEDGADAETPDEIAEGTESADGIDPADDVYVADGIEDGVEEGAEVPDGTEYVEDISADSEPEDVTGEDDVQDGAQDVADAEAEDDAEAPELGAASSGAKAAVYYNFQEDRNVLAGWWGNVDGWRDAWVEDDNGGHNENYKVLDVEIIEGQDLLSEFEEPKSDEEYYWFYRIRNGVMDGTVTFKVTYQKLDNTTDSYELHLYIGSEVWWVDLRSEGEHFQGLPGSNFALYADPHHEYYDSEGEYQRNTDGSYFEWSITDGSEYAEMQQDPDDSSRAALSMKPLPDNVDEADIRVKVRMFFDGEEKGSSEERFTVRNVYDEIWPTDLNRGLDVGASLENVSFTVRRYDKNGTAGEGYNAEHYKELENVTFAWEEFDGNAIQIKDTNGTVLQNNERASGNSFTITRLADWDFGYKIHAFWNEGSEEWDLDRHYWFDGKDYNIEFDRHDQDIFDDAEQAVVSLDMGELGENWDKRYGLEITMGVWENEQWAKLLDPDELGMRESHDANKTVLYINDIEKLFEATEGRDIRLLAEIVINTTTLCETDAWLHLREAEYNEYWGDERRFPGDMFFISKDEGKNLWVQNSDYPEGRDMHAKVTSVTIDSEESATDPRPVARVSDDDEGKGWDIKAIREGEATATLGLELYEYTNQGEKFYKNITSNFNIHVTGFIANIDLQSSIGSFGLMPGKTITIIPETNASYQDYDGYHEEDVSQNSIRYVFRLDEIDFEWADQNTEGNWTRAFRKTFEDGLWSVSVPSDSQKKLEWNEQEETYSLTVGGADRTIALAAKAGAPWMKLQLRAELLTDDLEGVLADTDRWIDICEDQYEIELADEWKTNLLPGQFATVNPSLVLYKNGQKDGTFVPENLTWRMEWEQRSGINFQEYAGSGEVIFNNEWDKQHVGIKDADGQVFQYNGDQTIDSGKAPFMVQRFVEWSSRVELIAEFTVDGENRDVRRTLYLEPVSVKSDITSNPVRGDEEKPARFYTAENFTVEADVTQLAAMGVDWTFTAGRWRWDEATDQGVFDPLYAYDVDSDGRRIDSSRKPFAFTASELQGNKLTLAGGDRLKEIWSALRYENNEWGDDVVGFDMVLEAKLNGLTILSDTFQVQLADSIKWMEDDEGWTMPGEDFFYKDSKATLYVENENHQGGTGDERGDNYEVTLTNIEVINYGSPEDEGCLVPEKMDGKGWYIRSVKPGDAEVKYTFTGGPDGITDHTTWLHVTDTWYYVDYEADRTLYPGDSDAVNLKLKKNVYNPTTKEIEYGKDVTGSFDVDYRWDNELLWLNEATGEFKVDEDARFGNTVISARIFNVAEAQFFESFEQVNIHIAGTKTELDINDAARFGMAPGETYSIDQLKSLLPKQITVKSMKNPDGTKKDAAEYFFEGGRPAVFSFSGPNGADRPWTKVTINEDILDWIEDGAVRPVQIRGITADGEEAVDELNLVIHNHKWSKVTYTWSKDNKTVTATRSVQSTAAQRSRRRL